ncbi:DNA-binding transcriptional MerR regulator [Bradyrhizobium sp. LM6.10]
MRRGTPKRRVLAKAAGISVPAIRYYESIGLLTAPARQGGQRIYGSDDLRALSLVRHCRELDFSIDETRDIFASVQRRLPCSDTKTFAEKHLGSIRKRIAELRAGDDVSCAGQRLRGDVLRECRAGLRDPAAGMRGLVTRWSESAIRGPLARHRALAGSRLRSTGPCCFAPLSSRRI